MSPVWTFRSMPATATTCPYRFARARASTGRLELGSVTQTLYAQIGLGMGVRQSRVNPRFRDTSASLPDETNPPDEAHGSDVVHTGHKRNPVAPGRCSGHEGHWSAEHIRTLTLLGGRICPLPADHSPSV
jgi:hypothetical protein